MKKEYEFSYEERADREEHDERMMWKASELAPKLSELFNRLPESDLRIVCEYYREESRIWGETMRKRAKNIGYDYVELAFNALTARDISLVDNSFPTHDEYKQMMGSWEEADFKLFGEHFYHTGSVEEILTERNIHDVYEEEDFDDAVTAELGYVDWKVHNAISNERHPRRESGKY